MEPVEGNLLAGFASILVNCDSSWDEFSALLGKSGIPHSGEFAVFFAKKWWFLAGAPRFDAVKASLPGTSPADYRVCPLPAGFNAPCVGFVGLRHPLQGLFACAAKLHVARQQALLAHGRVYV